jgi:hypothetical protein
MTSKQEELLNLLKKQEKLGQKINILKQDLDTSLSLREFVATYDLDDNIMQLLKENPNISHKIAYGCLVLNFKSFDMSECALEFNTDGEPEQLTIDGYQFEINCDTSQLDELIIFTRNHSHDMVKYHRINSTWNDFKHTYAITNSIVPL